ncbi:PAS domain S-box protein [Pseudoalteromonas sp. YIC-656]|uniref:sensor domain-containing protein n=1 Tax=Pseudoalteromonas pernae TaxID=3118054 RepID=UPI003241BAF7
MTKQYEDVQYRRIVEAATDAIISKTLQGIVTTWNKGAERLFGYSAQEMIGQPLLKIFPQDRVAEEADILTKIAAGEKVEHFRTIRLHKLGYPIHISANISPIYDDNGAVVGVSKVARDVSQEVELAKQATLLQAIVTCSDDAIISKTLGGVVTSWNLGAEKIFGYDADEMIGQSILKLFPSDRKNEEKYLIDQIIRGKNIEHFQTVRLRKNGTKVPIDVSLSPIKDDQGVIIGVSKIARDVSKRLQMEQKTKFFQAIVDSSDDAIISRDVNGLITSWNKGAEVLFGYSAELMLGNDMNAFIPDQCRGEEEFIFNQIENGNQVDHYVTQRVNRHGQILNVSLSVSPIKDVDGAVVGISSIFHDVTAQYEAENTLKLLGEIDILTQLLNRTALVKRLQEEIRDCKGTLSQFGLIYLDLDRFKDINDKQGHEFGDAVLCHIAEVVADVVYDKGVIGRIGSDEFLILLPHSDVHAVESIAKQILCELHKPFEIKNVMNVISGSIGVAMYPAHGVDHKTLITNADYALVESKQVGRNTYTVYNKELATALSRSQQISVELPKAIVTGQLFMNYQPIVDLNTEEVFKAEALIRWNHPQLGFVSPAEFISVAEENGSINDIGNWVFKEVTTQLVQWTKKYNPDFKVSINKSPVQFHTDDHAPQNWSEELNRLGLRCENLVVEITEGSLMKSTSVSEGKLRGFSGLGFELAIDDFGTGYSSLAYINKFHIDYIKIDRSFVSKIETHPDQLNICEGIILLAHKLGLKVIAEGIETEAQHRLLKAMECDYGQGYWYCRPVSAQAFEEFMQRVIKKEALEQPPANSTITSHIGRKKAR